MGVGVGSRAMELSYSGETLVFLSFESWVMTECVDLRRGPIYKINFDSGFIGVLVGVSMTRVYMALIRYDSIYSV